MTMTDLTPREMLEESIKRADEAEQAIIDKGAAASEDDHKAAADAFDEMQRAAQAFDRATKGQGIKDMLKGGEDVDGKTFDEMAAESGIINPKGGMTIGEAFVKSDAYQDLVEQSVGSDGTIRKGERIKSKAVDFQVGLTHLVQGALKWAEGEGVDIKTLVTGAGATSGGALIEPTRLPGVVDQDPLRRLTVWDLATKVPLSTDTLEYVELTARTNNAAFVAEATSADPAEADDVAAGRKPESGMTFAEKSNPVQTIAHWVPITRRAAADAPQLVQLINAFLVRGLGVKIEDGLLNGNGTSPNIAGLLNTTNPYAGLQAIDISAKVLGDADYTRWDALAEAASLVSVATEGMAQANAFLVNPADWFSGEFMLSKDADKNYQNGGPFAASGGSPWGLRPVLTTAVAVGNQVVGDWREMLIGDRQQAQLFMTDSHADFFTRNILVMLGEQRLSCGVRMPQAFVNIVA